MNESNLKLAQQDIDEALKTVDDLVKVIDTDDASTSIIKEKFVELTKKVQELEDILKSEGVL